MNKQLRKIYLANITHLTTSSLIKYKIYFLLNEIKNLVAGMHWPEVRGGSSHIDTCITQIY